MRTYSKKLLFIFVALLAAALAVAAVACDDDEDGADGGEPTATATPAEIPVVSFNATDYEYDAPASIAGGLTQLSMSNGGSEDHNAVFVRLNDGVTFGDFTGALADVAAEADLEGIGTLVSGPGAGPGGASDVVIDLAAGSYAVLCTVPDAEFVPHFALGMVQELEVTEARAEQPEPPKADVTVRLNDFAFDAPDTLPAGPTTFEVVNDGPQLHEMVVAALDEGFTADDLVALLLSTEPPPPDAGPPPFALIGAAVTMSTGESALTPVDLEAGNYAMICFVGDPDSGAPHFILGMVDSFTVEQQDT